MTYHGTVSDWQVSVEEFDRSLAVRNAELLGLEARCERLETERNLALIEIERLRSIMRMVEWIRKPDVRGIEHVAVVWQCPWCLHYKSEGHAESCECRSTVLLP